MGLIKTTNMNKSNEPFPIFRDSRGQLWSDWDLKDGVGIGDLKYAEFVSFSEWLSIKLLNTKLKNRDGKVLNWRVLKYEDKVYYDFNLFEWFLIKLRIKKWTK